MRSSYRRRILIVDDRKEITTLWKLALEGTGRYQVHAENHGGRVLAAAREFEPELFLLDMNMPDLDGSQVAAFVRADENLRETPIVFLTSLVSPDEVAAGKRIEGYPCVSKPTSVDGLVEVIEENLPLALAA